MKLSLACLLFAALPMYNLFHQEQGYRIEDIVAKHRLELSLLPKPTRSDQIRDLWQLSDSDSTGNINIWGDR